MVASAQQFRSGAPDILIDGESMRIHFDRWNIDSYRLFLQVKRIPEYKVDFDPTDDTYTVSAPARFASMLGVQTPDLIASPLNFSDFLFDDQDAITRIALAAKRFAVWTDCGNGKTLVQLEWARHVIHITGGRVLIITLNDVVEQTIEMCREFYGEGLPIHHIKSRAELREWCKSGPIGLAITNYEKTNPGDGEEQELHELRYLSGLVLDESSRLKTGGGVQKWAIIKSSKGIPYKLSCTATPAPNDTMEFASQASFLEKMRSESEIIWTYFTRHPKTHRWTVKKHARKAFFEFMSSWSIYMRDPRRYGWRKNIKDIPPPTIIEHDIEATPEQREIAVQFAMDSEGNRELYVHRDTNAIQRAKLSQIAKGFVYTKGESRIQRIESLKPGKVAEIVRQEIAAGRQVLVWTIFDAESQIIAEQLQGLPFEIITGKTKKKDRHDILDRFRHGQSPILISRASMLGWGMNFQFVGAMVFSGWNDSYEQWYQAIRRAYRYGQTQSLRVHVPIVRELEGEMLENIFRKQAQHEADIAEMEANYIAAMTSTGQLKAA